MLLHHQGLSTVIGSLSVDETSMPWELMALQSPIILQKERVSTWVMC